MSREDKIAEFDPNSAADLNSGIYGLPFDVDEAQIVIVPVPWDVTVSYKDGASGGPAAILLASGQVDLFDPSVPDAWKIGIAMQDISAEVVEQSKANRVIALGTDADVIPVINAASEWLNRWVEDQCARLLDAGKAVALLGGDHSTPLGFMKALAARHASFGILQIDAHADLRNAYGGFEYSHASIMTNALKIPNVSALVQAGIRDYCDEEAAVIATEKRVTTFFDRDLKRGRFEGATWAQQTATIVDALPEKVYISFDIDGFDPKLCPNTGTPVAGGFEYEEAIYLMESVARSGRKIIGVDLNEVAPNASNEWDANVGARLLYRMCNLMALSQKLA